MEDVDRLSGHSDTPIGPTAAIRVDSDAAQWQRLTDPAGEVAARAVRAAVASAGNLRAQRARERLEYLGDVDHDLSAADVDG